MKRILTAAAIGIGFWATPLVADVSLKGEGATFPKPLYDVWISKFHADNPDITIDYQGSGSGGGVEARGGGSCISKRLISQ